MISIARSALIALAAGAAAIGTPAFAVAYDATNSVVVRHGDLDLTTDAGVGTLNRRIGTAARAVCGTFHAADLTAKASVMTCRKVTLANTAPKVELAVSAARTGQQLAANGIAVGKSVP